MSVAVSNYPSLAEQEQYWETWQETKSITEWSLKRGETILSWLRALALERPKILDLGCGTGWFTEKLAHFGEATGIDLSQKTIELAQLQFPRATFIAGNLFEIPLPAAHFDVVVSQQVIAHVVDQAGYVERVANLLRPHGYLILSTPNKFVMDRLNWAPESSAHIENWLDLKSLKQLVRPHFRILRTTTIIPIGNRGILRLVNSYKLNTALSILIPRQYLEKLKERAGLGYTSLLLAQKRS